MSEQSVPLSLPFALPCRADEKETMNRTRVTSAPFLLLRSLWDFQRFAPAQTTCDWGINFYFIYKNKLNSFCTKFAQICNFFFLFLLFVSFRVALASSFMASACSIMVIRSKTLRILLNNKTLELNYRKVKEFYCIVYLASMEEIDEVSFVFELTRSLQTNAKATVHWDRKLCLKY